MNRKKQKTPTAAETVEMLASKCCTQDEIAEAIGISADTLQRDQELYGAWKRGHNNMKTSLRLRQFQSAMSGKVVMQIWLGKQYLGQKDKVDMTQETKLTISPEWANLRNAILSALELYPEAKQAVIGAVERLEDGNV